MQSIKALFHGVASQKGIRLTLQQDPALPEIVVADAQRLKQVLGNMVSNAVKFTEYGEVKLEVSGHMISNNVVQLNFVVRDTGIGIAEAAQADLFSPFYQAQSSHQRYGGTGLGLSICRRIIEMMDGTITLKSQLGLGTEVTVSLSLPTASEASLTNDTATHALSAVPGGYQGYVLVADDHLPSRALLQRQLTFLGIRSDIAANGEQALALWAENDYDLVITDCNMPIMSGFEFTKDLREAERSAQLLSIPIVGCTASADKSMIAHCMEAGMNDVMIKPLSLDQLLTVLATYLPVAVNLAVPETLAKSSGDNLQQWMFTPQVLATLTGGDKASEQLLMRQLQDSNLQNIALFEQAAKQHDRKLIADTAHQIRSGVRLLKAMEIDALCAEVEAEALTIEMETLIEKTVLLQHLLLRLNQETQQWITR